MTNTLFVFAHGALSDIIIGIKLFPYFSFFHFLAISSFIDALCVCFYFFDPILELGHLPSKLIAIISSSDALFIDPLASFKHCLSERCTHWEFILHLHVITVLLIIAQSLIEELLIHDVFWNEIEHFTVVELELLHEFNSCLV